MRRDAIRPGIARYLGIACVAVAAFLAASHACADSFESALSLGMIDGVNGFVFEGIDDDDQAGASVAAIGDVNGDGIGDLAIASSRATVDGVQFAGEVYVVFGTGVGFPARFALSDLDGTNGFILTGSVEFERVGSDVAAAGDFNDDGIADFLIGAYGGTSDDGAVGRCYLIFGRAGGFPASLSLASLDGVNGIAFNGIGVDDGCGNSLAGAGDLNGDGIDDICFGAEWADPEGRSNAGQCYVVYGKNDEFPAEWDVSTLNGSTGFTISGIAADNHVGRGVAFAGDLNGDGIDDLVVGASYVNSFAGAVYVIFGDDEGYPASFDLTSLDGSNGVALHGEDDEQAGASVSSAGDLNADGIVDLLIGATTSANPGRAFVVFGRTGAYPASYRLADLNGSNGFVFIGQHQNDNYGASVSNAGDLNSDGIDDLIIGSYSADPPTEAGSNQGQAFVLFGRDTGFPASMDVSSLNGANGFMLTGRDPDDNAGYDVASAGDVNGDGIDDILVSATGAGPGESEIGESYVVYGRLGCLVGSVDRTDDPDSDVLFVNASTGDAVSRTVSVREGARLWTTIVPPPAGGSGRFVVHANAGKPTVATATELPFDVGSICYPLILPTGSPLAIWNNLGKTMRLGESRYLDGTPIADPSLAPTTFMFLANGDAMNLPLGTVITLQGAIVDPASQSVKRVSSTNAVTIEIVP